MDTSTHSKPSSSSASHSPSPASITSAPRKTRDSGLCMTSDIIEIPAYCIDNLNSHQLGKGTYGVVEKTKYRKSKGHEWKPAAIKYSLPVHLPTLIREAKVMWQFRDHPNIIKIYGLYRCPRHGQGVVMEYMDCGSMADLVYERKSIDYTIDHAASWLFQLASAVDTFHRRDQVHRDLKLQNMLLSHQYRTLKLCDFGTFTAMHQSMTSNRGTPITMAPEVFRCEEYNTKSDIYSIGIIMWQIIARSHPYNRNLSVPGLLYNVATANLRPVEIPCNEILSEFYKLCWHDKADKRPTSGECVEYFRILKAQYPHGDVPLSDANTNGPAATPPPRAYRNPPIASVSGSGGLGGGTNGRTPTASNHLIAQIPTATQHRRNRSDTFMIQQDPLPYPIGSSVEPSNRPPRSQSEAKDLSRPHRQAPPLPPSRRDSNEEEKRALFAQLCRDEDFQPAESETRDQRSLDIFNEHKETVKELAAVLVVKKEAMMAKHEKLSLWPKHERHVELLERQNYLEREIARLEEAMMGEEEEECLRL